MGQYQAVLNNFPGTAAKAETVRKGLGLTDHPPIPTPMAGLDQSRSGRFDVLQASAK